MLAANSFASAADHALSSFWFVALFVFVLATTGVAITGTGALVVGGCVVGAGVGVRVTALTGVIGVGTLIAGILCGVAGVGIVSCCFGCGGVISGTTEGGGWRGGGARGGGIGNAAMMAVGEIITGCSCGVVVLADVVGGGMGSVCFCGAEGALVVLEGGGKSS